MPPITGADLALSPLPLSTSGAPPALQEALRPGSATSVASLVGPTPLPSATAPLLQPCCAEPAPLPSSPLLALPFPDPPSAGHPSPSTAGISGVECVYPGQSLAPVCPPVVVSGSRLSCAEHGTKEHSPVKGDAGMRERVQNSHTVGPRSSDHVLCVELPPCLLPRPPATCTAGTAVTSPTLTSSVMTATSSPRAAKTPASCSGVSFSAGGDPGPARGTDSVTRSL